VCCQLCLHFFLESFIIYEPRKLIVSILDGFFSSLTNEFFFIFRKHIKEIRARIEAIGSSHFQAMWNASDHLENYEKILKRARRGDT